MAWDNHLNIYGLSGTPPVSQDTPLSIAKTYATGTVNSTNLGGQILNSLIIGNAPDSDNAVYIDSRGIYAGSSIPSEAPFWVDLQGLLQANTTTIRTGTTGQRVVINAVTNEIDFYDSNGVLAGSIAGNLQAGNDVLSIQAGNTDTTAIILSAPTASGLARVLVSNYGGNADVTINTTDGVDSSAIDVQPTFLGLASTGAINFFPNGIASPPVVTGSLGGNAALASLVTELAGLGLILDGTSP